jgi:hypothetical protein
MTKRPVLSDVTSLTNSSNINVINQNWDAIEAAFDNTVSRDGSIPNTMAGDLDLNGNALLNVGTIDVNALTIDGQQVVDLASIPEWRGAWLTATSYIKNDLVKEAGNVYICLVSHTSGTFSTDLTSDKWELMVSKGDSGAGTGDLLASNNLSDLANAATARANLGLGTAATENTVPVSKGGTGATDATTALSNLGAQAAGATLTSLEALSLVAGDLLYATAADTLVRLPKGTAGQVLVMNSGATAPEWSSTSSGATLLGTFTTTSGNSVSVNSLDLTTYTFLKFTIIGVGTTGSATISLAGEQAFSTSSGTSTIRGFIELDLSQGVFSCTFADAGANDSNIANSRGGDTSITNASTSITITTSGTFDAGSIRLYGIK